MTVQLMLLTLGQREKWVKSKRKAGRAPKRISGSVARVGTAYHEAGHAVARWCVGLGFAKVSIRKRFDANGWCSGNNPLYGRDIAAEITDIDRINARRYA